MASNDFEVIVPLYLYVLAGRKPPTAKQRRRLARREIYGGPFDGVTTCMPNIVNWERSQIDVSPLVPWIGTPDSRLARCFARLWPEGGKSKTKIWSDIKAVEKQIGEGLEQPNVRRLCQHVHDLLGEAVPLRRIERSFGHNPDSRAVKNWIESLIAGEWAEEEATMTEDPAY